jgi:hypothetical protein
MASSIGGHLRINSLESQKPIKSLVTFLSDAQRPTKSIGCDLLDAFTVNCQVIAQNLKMF